MKYEFTMVVQPDRHFSTKDLPPVCYARGQNLSNSHPEVSTVLVQANWFNLSVRYVDIAGKELARFDHAHNPKNLVRCFINHGYGHTCTRGAKPSRFLFCFSKSAVRSVSAQVRVEPGETIYVLSSKRTCTPNVATLKTPEYYVEHGEHQVLTESQKVDLTHVSTFLGPGEVPGTRIRQGSQYVFLEALSIWDEQAALNVIDNPKATLKFVDDLTLSTRTTIRNRTGNHARKLKAQELHKVSDEGGGEAKKKRSYGRCYTELYFVSEEIKALSAADFKEVVQYSDANPGVVDSTVIAQLKYRQKQELNGEKAQEVTRHIKAKQASCEKTAFSKPTMTVAPIEVIDTFAPLAPMPYQQMPLMTYPQMAQMPMVPLMPYPQMAQMPMVPYSPMFDTSMWMPMSMPAFVPQAMAAPEPDHLLDQANQVLIDIVTDTNPSMQDLGTQTVEEHLSPKAPKQSEHEYSLRELLGQNNGQGDDLDMIMSVLNTSVSDEHLGTEDPVLKSPDDMWNFDEFAQMPYSAKRFKSSSSSSN